MGDGGEVCNYSREERQELVGGLVLGTHGVGSSCERT